MNTRAWLLIVCAIALPVRAQQICKESDTRDTCLKAVSDFVAGQRADVEKKKVDMVATKNTGEGTIGTAGGPSATNDFLPLLRALIDSSQAVGGQQGAVGVEWSNPLALPPQHQNKLSIVTVKSSVYEPLQDALRAASLADSIAALDKRIDSGDDIAVSFTYALASARVGRDPNLNSDLFSALLAEADTTDDESLQLADAAAAKQKALEDELHLAHRFAGPFTDVPKAKRNQYIAAVEQEHMAEFLSMTALQGRLTKNGFYGLLDLVNNQPQLTFAASYRKRDPSVGPDEIHLSVSYEKGWYNVNTYREACSSHVGEGACLARYLARDEVRKGVATSPRVSFSAEYLQRQKLDFALTGSAFRYHEDSSKSFKLNAIYARYIGAENTTGTRPRLDVALSYEDVSRDPSRQDRGLLSATLSYPVAQGFYLSLGAVYATKPEFRGDVDKELSARAGLVYKVLRSKD